MLKKAYDLGFKYEKDYTNCAQCVIAAVHDVLDMRNDDIFKAACGLAGGLAICGDSACGALSGGVLVIGEIFGRERKEFEDRGKTKKSVAISKRLHDKFMDEYGSCICSGVQEKVYGRSFNLWDANDVEEFEKAGAHTDKCPDVVGKAASWAVEILLDEQKGLQR